MSKVRILKTNDGICEMLLRRENLVTLECFQLQSLTLIMNTQVIKIIKLRKQLSRHC